MPSVRKEIERNDLFISANLYKLNIYLRLETPPPLCDPLPPLYELPLLLLEVDPLLLYVPELPLLKEEPLLPELLGVDLL